jgi:S1-C subfamily serine protease
MNSVNRTTAIVASAVGLAAVAGAGVGAGSYAAFSGGNGSTTTITREATPAPVARTATAELPVTEIYRRAAQSVVEITTTLGNTGNTPFGGSQTEEAQGSGFVYDTDGHIVTNEHVVAGATSLYVTLQDGKRLKATVVGSDASTDVAVIKVDPSGLKPLQLADSSQVQVGEGAVAIGSPFGYEDSVTAGIVSALHRQIDAPNNFTIDDAIQTDAAINHGNSGGVLLDMQGHVIGVTAQIASDNGGNNGVGFAIPSNTVKSVAKQLIASGSVGHAYLGVTITTIPASAAQALGLPAGVELTTVKAGTPAAKAGLVGSKGSKTVAGQSFPTGGDVITRVDGKLVATADALRDAIDSHQPGETVTITYTRNGVEHNAQVKLVDRPS